MRREEKTACTGIRTKKLSYLSQVLQPLNCTAPLNELVLWYDSMVKYPKLVCFPAVALILNCFVQLRSKTAEERMKYTNGLMMKFPKFFRLWAGPLSAAVALYHPDSIRGLLKTSGTCSFLVSVNIVRLLLTSGRSLVSGWYVLLYGL